MPKSITPETLNKTGLFVNIKSLNVFVTEVTRVGFMINSSN